MSYNTNTRISTAFSDAVESAGLTDKAMAKAMRLAGAKHAHALLVAGLRTGHATWTVKTLEAASAVLNVDLLARAGRMSVDLGGAA